MTDPFFLASRVADDGAGAPFRIGATYFRQYESTRDVLDWVGLGDAGGGSGADLAKYVYDTNDRGQRLSVTRTGSMWPTTPDVVDWTYNPRGEVVEADHDLDAGGSHNRAFAYDAIGNRKKAVDGLVADLPGTDNYTTNALNQYTEVPADETLDHDDDGNLVDGMLATLDMATGSSTPYRATLTWNAENQLMQVESTEGTEAEFLYDPLGRRIAKKVGANTLWFVYDGWNVIGEYSQSGTGTPSHKRRYIWGLDLAGLTGGGMQGAGGVGGLLCLRDIASGVDYLPSYDGNGNVTELVKPKVSVQGSYTVGTYEYDAFGNQIAVDDQETTGNFIEENPIRFSTKYQDGETGLLYYGFRYIDPVTGRWVSRDPIEERGGMNLYGFVGNNGVNQLDRLGLLNLAQLMEESGVTAGIKAGSLKPDSVYHGWTDSKPCPPCGVKFTFSEAYKGVYKYLNKHDTYGVSVNLQGKLLNNTDIHCQDAKLLQFAKSVKDAAGNKATGLPTDLVPLTNQAGWRVDADPAAATPYVDDTPFADINNSGTGFDLFDPPGDPFLGLQRGKRLLTCISARCRDKNGAVGQRKIIGCIEWGYLPIKSRGKVIDVIFAPSPPIIHCGFPDAVGGGVDGAESKWNKVHERETR